MKDLGKKTSPSQDIIVVDLFSNGDDEQQKFTDTVMDKHLCALQDDSLIKTDASCDIAKYMANLKEKHMESEQLVVQVDDQPSVEHKIEVIEIGSDTEKPTIDIISGSGSSSNSSKSKSRRQSVVEKHTDEITVVIIDDNLDACSRSSSPKTKSPKSPKSKTEQTHKHTLKTQSKSSHMSHSPDRSKSTGSSPIKIIKVKSPRSSIDSGKCLSLSRDSSKERSPDRQHRHSTSSSSPRRLSEGGILKRSSSPKPDVIHYRRSPSPNSKVIEGCVRQSLSHGSSIDSRSPDRHRLSPHGSFDSRSPDRRPYIPTTSSEPNLDSSRSAMKSPRGSFDSRSPDRGPHMRSLSAHSSLDKSRSPDHYYQQYFQYYEPNSPTQRHQTHKRQSKSLERTSSRDSSVGGGYRYGLSPERVYRMESNRSHSSENTAYMKHAMDMAARSNESLARSIEHPTCVECLYQRKPS